MVCSIRILHVGLFRKCAILFVRFLQIADGAGDLRKPHLGYIADGSAEGVDRFRRIEVQEIAEILADEIFVRVDSAPRHQHICHAGLERVPIGDLYIEIVQFLQKAVFTGDQQVVKVVGHVVLDGVFCGGEQRRRQILFAFQFPEAVFKRFDDVRFIRRLHFQKGNGTGKPALMGVRNIKVVFQARPVRVLQVKHRNAFRAPVYPASKPLVPAVFPLDFQDGNSVRALRMDKHLFVKGKPVIAAGGAQKRRPAFRPGGNLL